jgi:hypothetical protein
MTVDLDQFTKTQRDALDALLSSKTRTEAAQKAGINRSTLYSYLEDDAFSDALSELRIDAFSQLSFGLVDDMIAGADMLASLYRDEENAGNLRIRAWAELRDLNMLLLELTDLYRRIGAIEGRSEALSDAEARLQQWQVANQDVLQDAAA